MIGRYALVFFASSTALLAAACDSGQLDGSAEDDVNNQLTGVPAHTAARFGAPPSIDGALGEYSTLPAITLAGTSGSADVRAAWDAQALYIAFDVTDGALLPASGTESDLWDGDGIEVMVDTANDRSATADLNDYHFLVSSSGQLADSRGWSDYTYTSGATVQAVPRSGGYRVELKIPFSSLGVTPSTGLQLGFDVAFNDRDLAGGALSSTDDAGLTAFNDPAGWGTVVLGASMHTAPHFGVAPSIDGGLDEYASVPAIALAGASGSADVRVGWDAQALYLGFEVTDGTLSPASGAESGVWDGDGIEVMIDTANDRSITADLNDYHFLVSSSGQLADSRGWSDYTYASGATVQVVPHTGGYRVELEIPFASLGVTPSDGLQLGFDVAFNDRDGAGGALSSKDFAGLTAFNKPAGWGALVLGATTVTPPMSCGDGVCGGGETCSSCSEDCGPCSSYGTTYYVRPDGGDATQCNGRADVKYSGSGTYQACAWSHPFVALPPAGTARIAGGDQLVIATGSYMMGAGAPGTASCSYSPECVAAAIPSGPDAAHPTRIVGAEAASGCAHKAELWGTEQAAYVFNLTNRKHVAFECLDLTDHSECVVGHTGSIACQRATVPYGPWARVGIYAADSEDVSFRDVDIHGFAGNGINAGRVKDWTLEDVRIVANGWAGWDGNVGANSSNAGTLSFKRVTIEWNGCGETYPGKQPTGCWGQSAGGYGDGLGMYYTAGDWIFEDSVISHNTSDGLDLLYHDGAGTITIERSRFEGNAGNQVKVRGDAVMRNNLVVGNCGYFSGKPFTFNVGNCRANGNAFSLTLDAGQRANLTNNTVFSQGDCLFVATSACTAASSIVSKNNVLLGGVDYLQGDRSCFLYTECSKLTMTDTSDIVWGVKNSVCPAGANNLCVDPRLVSSAPASFDGRLQSTSPAMNSGLPVGGDVPSVDLTGKARPSGTGVERGAYEMSP